MGEALTIIFGLGVMMFGTWLAIFGVGGAFLSRSYGESAVIGGLLGCALGPVAWFFIWWTNRDKAGANGGPPSSKEDRVLSDKTAG